MKSYNEVKKLTKQELLKEYVELSTEYEELESNYNNLNDWAGEQENAAFEYSKQLEEMKKPNNKNNDKVSIVNVNNFIRQLTNENLYNDRLEEFIQSYLRYSNE